MNPDRLLDALEATNKAAGARAMVRELRGELARLIRERDAARDALRGGHASDRLTMTITPTAHLTMIDEVPVRVWEGRTGDGIACHVFVHRIAVGGDADQTRFERELQGVNPPKFIPLVAILAGKGGG